jgi:hypothetical protein
MSHGPMMKPMNNAVIAAPTERTVMYCSKRNGPKTSAYWER